MKAGGILAVILLLGLSGCATQLEKEATAKMEQECASKGLQFVKTDSEKTDNIVESKAMVEGVCVGHGDPRYVASKKAP